MPEERREIEAKLFSDELQGVIATSALEMGIDVGGLDVCLLVGYPGTVINTWQRGGRVGRGTMEYLIILIAQQDALDQYFMRNPTDFFQRGYERAVLDPDNPEIVKQHLVCAASESPLNVDDQVFNVKEHIDILHQLSLDGQLQPDEENKTWYSSRKRPHRLVDIRSVGEGFTIFEDSTNRVIGKVSG
ncbi:MAG: helicase-related protein [Nitrospinota bacterium]|nr:helicase-related protein [Nitrospinota bacterium]